jgi:hypothetical protein
VSGPAVRATHRRLRRWVTHPVAPAASVALAAAVVLGVLAAGGNEPAVVIAWALLSVAAGYAVSGSP